MNSELLQLAQILSSLVTAVVGILVSAALKTKIDLPTYQAKITELHNTINDQGRRIAVLEDRETRQ